MTEADSTVAQPSGFRQIWHFILHLRWHYQLLILSGGFLMGGFYADTMHWNTFIRQFLNVHLLLFGGATAYNSYWDRDEGPVGGLQSPPPMSRWMWFAALLMQVIGLLLAIPAGTLYTAIYGSSMLFFWLYSSPLARWKGTPLKSILAIGISTGTNSVLLGYLSANGDPITGGVLVCSAGVALLILSLYPVSQIFQIDEDERRDDRTFAVKYGISGVIRFFIGSYILGILLISASLAVKSMNIGLIFLVLAALVGLVIWKLMRGLNMDRDDYRRVMGIKYITSFAFVLFVLSVLLLKHTDLGPLFGTGLF